MCVWGGYTEMEGVLLPVDCTWQSELILAAPSKMESDSSVREFERLSGRAGIQMIPSLSSPKSPAYAREASTVTEEGEERKNKPGTVCG